MGRIAWGKQWLKGPRHWTTEDDAVLMIQYVADPYSGDVDQRLCVFAAAQCVKLALGKIEEPRLRHEANAAIAAAEAWVRGEVTSQHVRHLASWSTEETAPRLRGQQPGEDRRQPWDALRAVIYIAEATSAWTRESRGVQQRLAWALSGAARARGVVHRRQRQPEFADIIRVVIPYPRAGELIAMGPRFFVMSPYAERSVLGLQQPPRKISGRWWDGYIEGPAEEIIASIPDPETMREVYEIVVVGKRK
jgi:hypothetical protein